MAATIHTDQLYIQALKESDMPLVKEIYRRFAGNITAMVVQNSGTAADAADILQDALLDIYKKAKSGTITLTCSFEAFLYAVCRNKWLMELRKRKNKPVTLLGERQLDINEHSMEKAEQLAQYGARKKLLMEKLQELNEGCRKLLQLNWGGMGMQEIAVALNMSYGYARRKKGECLGRLVQLMKKAAEFQQLKH